MKFAEIVTNALELCDSCIEITCEYQALHMYWRYVDRQKKIRDWYLRRLIKNS